VVEEVSTVPIALDSSSPDVVRAGLEQSQGRVGRPLLNSASLERLEVLDLAATAGCPVVITAAGAHGLPADGEERVANASRMVELAVERGLAPGELFIDPLVMPAAAHPEAAAHCLEAISRLRSHWGPAIHITGGFSNVSFGLPTRRLVNDAFLALVIEAGADSGIIDPLTSDPGRAVAIDRASLPCRLALDLLLGRDRYGRQFLAAHRAGQLGRTQTS
jgi:5-methyltetrahydrofolate--homocysteine methyltransferase